MTIAAAREDDRQTREDSSRPDVEKYWGKQYETKMGFNAFTMSFNAQDNSYVLTEAFKVASPYRTTKSYTMVVVEYTGDFLPLPIAGLFGYWIYCNSKVEIVK